MVWSGHGPKPESETLHCAHCTLGDRAEIGHQAIGTTPGDSWAIDIGEQEPTASIVRTIRTANGHHETTPTPLHTEDHRHGQ